MPANTPEEAADKWERKTSQEKWEKGLDERDQDPADGLADFWGGSPDDYSDLNNTWSQEVQAARDSNSYESNTSGKGDKWMRNARRGAQN